jgi:hypothetical protein
MDSMKMALKAHWMLLHNLIKCMDSTDACDL